MSTVYMYLVLSFLRKNPLDHLPVHTENGSPEFLPPNAKVQKLGNENTGVVPTEPAKTCACDQDLQSLKPDTAFNAEKTAAERLKEIKKQEGKIEELLLVLKAQLKGEGKVVNDSQKRIMLDVIIYFAISRSLELLLF